MQIEETKPRWGTLLVLFLVLAGLAALPFFLFRAQAQVPLPSYEIQNFIGKVEIYSNKQRAWVPANRGTKVGARDKVRTGPGGEIDLRVPDQIRIRIKENSEAEVKAPRLFERTLRYRLHLLRGNLLGSTEKDFKGQKLEISTPVLVAAVRGTSFQVSASPEKDESAVLVLQGTVNVRSLRTRKVVVVRALEKTEVKGSAPPSQPTRVTRDEWNRMKEAYELIQKSAAFEAHQMDLSREAGSLFQYVFDHGTFYTPNFGFSNREFIKDETTGQVHLEVEYDVFPAGSFVGMYTKVRDLDIAKFKGFRFEVRGDPEEGYPESFKIEFKSKNALVRSFVPRDYREKWQTFEYPLRFNRSTPLAEITFVFANEKVGAHKKGKLLIRNVTLIPLPPEELAKLAKASSLSRPVPAASRTPQ